MGFEKGRAKTGGRKAGTRNKVNMFNQETIEQAKVVIAEQVAKGDIEACKLVLSYSLSKPKNHDVGVVATHTQVKNAMLIRRITRNNDDSELFYY